MYFLDDHFDECCQKFKVKYYPNDIEIFTKLTPEDKAIKSITERLTLYITFVCHNPVYKLRVYQKQLAREGIIITMALIVGASEWDQHRVRLLDDLNIVHFETLFSVTGRRFGKTILLAVFVSGVMLYAVNTVRVFAVGVFSIALDASIRLLEEVATVLKQCQYMFANKYVLEESQKKIVLRNKSNSTDVRKCHAYCGNGKSTMYIY